MSAFTGLLFCNIIYFCYDTIRSNIKIFRGRSVSAESDSTKTKSQMMFAEVDKVYTVMGNLRQKQVLETLPGIVEQEESGL